MMEVVESKGGIKRKVVSVLIASSLGIGGGVNFFKQDFTEEMAIEGSAGMAPLVVDLEEAFFGKGGCYSGTKPEEPIVINSISFITKANTMELPEYKDYLVQGILYYSKDGEPEQRIFRDRVGSESIEYALVSKKPSVSAKFDIGKEDYLCMDLAEMKIEFTWMTPSSISIYDLQATDTNGNIYNVAMGEIYSAYVSEKEQIAEVGGSGMPFNCDFYVSSTYNEYRGGNEYHGGMDLCSQGDFTIFATHSGTVEYADWQSSDPGEGFGQYIKIVGDDGRWYYYGHCSELYVAVGERVEAGQPIAYEGTTGSSTGNHLHYEIRVPNEYGWETADCAESLGIPNEYGMVCIEDYIPSTPETVVSGDDTELAIQCLSFNKYFEAGSLKANAINPDDKGACSIGIIQMRGENAQKLLTALRESNTKEFDRIAKKYDPEIIDYLSDNLWESRTAEPGTALFGFLTEVLIQDWAVQAQWDYVIQHELNIIAYAKRNGITDPKAIMLYTRAYNYGPGTGSALNLIELGNNGECSFENAAATVQFLKATEAIRVVDEMSFPILTIDDIK